MRDKESSIKKLQKKLYAKKDVLRHEGRKHFTRVPDSTVADDWKDEEVKTKKQEEEKKPKKKMTVFTKILIASVGFFLLSVLAAFYVFSSGQNTVQHDRVGVSILGPNTIGGGEPLLFDVIVTNDNQVDIRLTDIIVTYPEGSFAADEDGVGLSKEIRPIDSIQAGTQTREKFGAVLFGQEGEAKDIKITYEYRVPDSNAILYKERVYQVKLESSPLSMNITHPKETLSGENIEMSIEIVSNANKPIENLFLHVEYPFGFDYQEADPVPEQDRTDLFGLGTLAVGGSKTVKIIGTINGQDDEQRVFRHRIGLFNPTTSEIENTLSTDQSVVAISKPPVTLTSTLNNRDALIHVIEPGSNIRINNILQNNLATQIFDAEVSAILAGNVFDEQRLRTDGYYNSNTNNLLWQKSDVTGLGTIESGASVEFFADVLLLTSAQMAGAVTDPTIDVQYVVGGQTFDFENNQKSVSIKKNTKIKIPTVLTLENRVLHSIGPFENNGPLTPTVGETSEYTISWKLNNTTSELKDAIMTTTLPPYVEYVQAQQIENGTFSYNQQNRQITWKLPEIAAGAGYSTAAPTVSFQVRVTPSLSQVDSPLDLTQDRSLRGFDTFSETLRIINDTEKDTTRLLRLDPSYKSGNGNVITGG